MILQYNGHLSLSASVRQLELKEEGCFFEAIYLVDEARKPFAAKIKRPKNQTNQLVGAYY